VRINGRDTHYMYRDVVDVVEQAGERLDLIMIPKVGTAADVYAVDMMVTQIEDAKGYKKRVGFEHIIETALGMQNVTEIAGASKRNESLHFGVADYAASTRARTTIIGGVNPDYSVLTDTLEDGSRAVHWGDMWHYALARMVVAARANGLRPVDGPFGAGAQQGVHHQVRLGQPTGQGLQGLGRFGRQDLDGSGPAKGGPRDPDHLRRSRRDRAVAEREPRQVGVIRNPPRRQHPRQRIERHPWPGDAKAGLSAERRPPRPQEGR